MRRSFVVVLLVVAACSSGQELAPTTPSTSPPTTEPAPQATTTTGTDATTRTGEPTTTTTLPELQGLAYEEVTTMDFPIQIVPRNVSESLVAEKNGRVFAFDGETVADEPLLDISGSVRDSGEQGLLSLVVPRRRHATVHPLLGE